MTDTLAGDHVGTYDDLIAQHGDPQDGGTPQAAAAARHLASLHQQRMDGILSRVQTERRGALSASESRAFDTHRTQAEMLTRAAELYGQRAERAAEDAVATGNTGARGNLFHTSGGHTYRKGDQSGPSWVRDMVAFGLRGDPDAASRLHRNNREVSLESRALSGTDGAGGEFVPPLWMVNDYVALARAARVAANLVSNQALPAGTDSLNIPKLATGTAVAEQATQNTAVQNTDATTTSVTASVATLAGQQVVSVQMIEQSPLNVDQMLLGDLIADLAAKVDTFVLNNNAANKRGLLNATGVNAVTYTDASPTVAELFAKLADARQQIENGRFLPPTAIVMHPRRWAWALSALDAQQRPLVVPDAQGPHNAFGTSSGVSDAAGRVGSMLGLPVYVDALVPTNLGAGTNEDRVIVVRAEDSILWESTLRAESFRDTKADQLSVLLRVYEYVAFTAERYPKSTSVVSGTGLITPTF